MLAPYAQSRPPRSLWPEERIERLKQLWDEGLSASQIAAEMGGLTRCAVLGKVHRLGLTARKVTAEVRPGDKPLRNGVRLRHTPKFDKRHLQTLVHSASPFVAEKVAEFILGITSPNQKTLLELTKTCCRWPLGDPSTPEFRFCGNEKWKVLSYCAGHCRIAYQPARR